LSIASDPDLLVGININKGQKICLRLRYPGDQNQFLPLEQVVDTMLHELAHNVHGPHNTEFHALWNQQREEYEALLRKGYTGEGFLSEGKKLGGKSVPRDEARRIARAAAEKRRTLYSGSGQKLGGAPVRQGEDIRRVIVDAIERRATVLKGCGSGNKDDKEMKAIGDKATENGFKTKAEEDEANERAISQAMWDLVQEEEKEKYGNAYIPPTAANPTGNGGGTLQPEPEKSANTSDYAKLSSPGPTPSTSTRQLPRHTSRLVSQSASAKPKPIPKKAAEPPAPDPPFPTPLKTPGWTCSICTLHNPLNYLCCDACATERPAETTGKTAEGNTKKQKITMTQSKGMQPQTWQCQRCSTVMESQWWTCATCGKMKQSS
jgi:hypothetical protein